MSEHKSLAEALAAFQAEAPTLAKDGRNPHFNSRFTPLDTIVETIRPLLAKHGLAWSALPCFHDGQPALRYELCHAATGQVLGDTMPLLMQKSDPQGMGSAITYARRYSLAAVLNLVSDEDDDGNSASRRQQNGGQTAAPTAAPVQQTERPASASQRGMLNARAAGKDEKGKQAHEPLAPSEFANVLLVAAGGETRDFESQEHAQQFVNRNLDRLPARLVTPVLEEMARLRVKA